MRIYVDETGSDSYYYRECGYAPRGEKVFGEIAGKKFGRTNPVAAKLGNRLLAPMYYKESADSAVFEVWFERRFMPLLSPGHVVIMDNASFHRKAELRKIAARYQVRRLFLLPYSPDLNPIEKIWANIKSHMREYDSFGDALEAALDFYS